MNSLKGLSTKEAHKRFIQFGPNELAEKKPPGHAVLLFQQLKSPLVYILLAASATTYVLGDIIDTGIILLAVFINTILGFIQENKAQHSLLALKRMLTPQAKVIRDGNINTIDHKTVVPGDLIVVSAGDRIPADARVLESSGLYINEAILTGESVPVSKSREDTNNLVYMGTTVSSGRGIIVADTTGVHTRIGSLASSLSDTQEEETPLQRELQKLARVLACIVVGVSTLLFILGIARGEQVATMFATAVAVAVAAIPEGMVVSLTVILAIGMQRILKRKAIVRRLIAAETLGSLTTLCIDKTGTLTEGIMRITKHKLTDISLGTKAAIFANNMNDPLEVALWEWTQSQDHVDPQKLSDSTPRYSEIPFDERHKYLAVSNSEGIFVKGAPEVLLAKSSLSEVEKTTWTKILNEYAQIGLRIIAVAHKSMISPDNLENELTGLTFLGIFGVSDPVRVGIEKALLSCQKAGIRVVVITGDYRLTAESILSQLGIPISNPSVQILEGKELDELTAEDLRKRLDNIILFCRTTPEQKLKIVEAFQKNGHVVAMMGDGVNDAPAIKKADIGIVVSGASDVARETADLVLLDANFQTVVGAIEVGRNMFNNIRKVVTYLLSDAFTEIILLTISIIVGSIIVGFPLPLTAIQILWINILSDGLPNLALSLEPKEHDIMNHPPRRKNAPIINAPLSFLIISISVAKAFIAFGLFTWIWFQSSNLAYAQTITFAFIGTSSLMYVFSLRTLNKPILHDHIFKNTWLLAAVVVGFILQIFVIYFPPVATLFHSHPLALTDWALVLGASCIIILGIEIAKIIAQKKRMLTRTHLKTLTLLLF